MKKSGLKWLMRNDAGKNFGPVDTETLIGWSDDNRIAPSFKLSSDGGNTWIAAADAVELQMTWFAEISPGNVYGPVSKTAIENLIKEGALPQKVKVFEKAPKQKREAETKRAAPKRPSEKDKQIKSLTKQVKDTEKLLKEKDLQLEELHKKADHAENLLADIRSRLAEKESLLDEEIKKNALLSRQIGENAGEIDKLKKELKRECGENAKLAECELAHREKLELLESELENERATLHRLEEHLKTENDGAAELQRAIENLQKRICELEEQNDCLQNELNDLKAPPEPAGAEEFTDFEIVEPEVVSTETPVATSGKNNAPAAVQVAVGDSGARKTRMSLKDIEEQARRELAALGVKGSFSALFARK